MKLSQASCHERREAGTRVRSGRRLVHMPGMCTDRLTVARGHARPAWRVLTDGPSRSNCFSAYQTSLKVPQPLFPLHTLGIRSRQFEFYLKSVTFECAGTGTRRLRLSARKVERFLLSRFTSPLLAQLRLLPSFRSIR